MAKNDTTSAVIDGLLKTLIMGGIISTIVIAPNAVQAMDKPLAHFMKKLDKRTREREIRRITMYMRRQGLLTGDYEHGLAITKLGRRRLDKMEFDKLQIPKPKKWDKKWRLIIFDIPESNRQGRVALTSKLRSMGVQPLQQSVWIHPHSCRNEVARICTEFAISRWVTYLETDHIDHHQLMINRFKHII